MRWIPLILLLTGCSQLTFNSDECPITNEIGKIDKGLKFRAQVQCGFLKQCLAKIDYTKKEVVCG